MLFSLHLWPSHRWFIVTVLLKAWFVQLVERHQWNACDKLQFLSPLKFDPVKLPVTRPAQREAIVHQPSLGHVRGDLRGKKFGGQRSKVLRCVDRVEDVALILLEHDTVNLQSLDAQRLHHVRIAASIADHHVGQTWVTVSARGKYITQQSGAALPFS